MKRLLCVLIAVFVLITSIQGCGINNVEDDPARAEMQAKIGINEEITGSYDHSLAAVVSNGTFVGEKEGDVISYKGIPFAKPPVGELRWKDPVPVEDGDGVYEARYFGKSPIQTEWFTEVGSYYLQGEDCLTLNVWTNPNGPAEGKTVMVFFHGGSYGWGATSDPMYDGHNLVEKYPDLVLVTAEYRTGMMGFIDFSGVPGGEEYATSGNLGLLDQVCALKWVQKNIASFGGDPSNVTIFGESAGGGSVSLLPLIDGTKGLFGRIIAESGGPNLTYSREECQNLTELLLEESGCSNMEELMALSEEEIMKLNEKLNDSNNFPERDGIVLPEDVYGAWGREDLEDLDIMVGTNKDEMRYWIREMGLTVPVLPGMPVYEHALPFMYENNIKELSEAERELVRRFMKLQKEDKVWRLTEFYNEILFRLPAMEQALRHMGTSYTYYWTMPCSDKTLGACHAVELAYVFNNPQEDIYIGDLYDEQLGDTVQDMWVNFARCGDPSTPDYTWEPYDAETRKTMVLGDTVGMVEDLKMEQRQLLEPLLEHYFNGCYAQLDYTVPQLNRIVVQLLATALLVALAVFSITRAVKRYRKMKKDSR